MKDNNLYFLTIVAVFSTAAALECYTCSQQDSNREKCIKTTKQCEQYQDACISEIRWAIPPYWTPRGNRINYLSKDCETSVNCAKRKEATQSGCVRDWYLDWYCIDCCQGDLCNYYATLGSARLQVHLATTIGSLLIAFGAVLRFL